MKKPQINKDDRNFSIENSSILLSLWILFWIFTHFETQYPNAYSALVLMLKSSCSIMGIIYFILGLHTIILHMKDPTKQCLIRGTLCLIFGTLFLTTNILISGKMHQII